MYFESHKVNPVLETQVFSNYFVGWCFFNEGSFDIIERVESEKLEVNYVEVSVNNLFLDIHQDKVSLF